MGSTRKFNIMKRCKTTKSSSWIVVLGSQKLIIYSHLKPCLEPKYQILCNGFHGGGFVYWTNLNKAIHNIIHVHNNVMWDGQYYAKYSSHSVWMWGILCIILSVPHNIVMDLNNVMLHWRLIFPPCNIWERVVFDGAYHMYTHSTVFRSGDRHHNGGFHGGFLRTS